MKNPKFWQVSEVKVTYRNVLQIADRPTINSSRDAENILRENWSDDMELLEEFNVLFLTKANQVKGIFRVSRGGTAGTVVDIKILFATALKGMAAALVVAHNHPSGSISPSQADIDLTRKLRKAGEMFDLPILDHLILAPYGGYYSFADEGIL
jgi:DNA repair protein RadC